MAKLYDETAGVEISRYVQVEESPDVNQIISTALDGSVHIQIVGEPAVSYTGTVYVTRAGKAALQSAYAAGNLLRVELKRGTYYGRLTACKPGNRMAGDTFAVSITLAKEAVS